MNMVKVNITGDTDSAEAIGESALVFVSTPADKEHDMTTMAMGSGNLLASIEEVMKGCGSLVRQLTQNPDELQIIALYLAKTLKEAVIEGLSYDEVIQKKIIREEDK